MILQIRVTVSLLKKVKCRKWKIVFERMVHHSKILSIISEGLEYRFRRWYYSFFQRLNITFGQMNKVIHLLVPEIIANGDVKNINIEVLISWKNSSECSVSSDKYSFTMVSWNLNATVCCFTTKYNTIIWSIINRQFGK